VCLYDDGSNTVVIATLTNSIGSLTSSNQITYTNCFAGIHADLVCTYRRGGFECDLIFRTQPPAPDQFGLDASFATLQLVTEFFDTPDPEQIPAASDDAFGLQDDTLRFGKLTMTHGRAFAFQVSGTNSPSQTRVYKSWLHLSGRTFLVEQVPVPYVAADLDALPLSASLPKPASSTSRLASGGSAYPMGHGLVASTNRILIASVNSPKQPGVVLDYNTVDDGSDTYTFASGQTYYISGTVNLTGTTTIKGGAIIKYDSDAQLTVTSVDCATTVDSPAILTSMNDDSVGESIDGSTGVPIIDYTVETGSPGAFGAYIYYGDGDEHLAQRGQLIILSYLI
jgi:hypothetical protein